LARDPTIQQKARDEALLVLGDAPENVVPTLDDTRRFAFIDQVIMETLRYTPPLPTGTPRVVSSDTTLAGHTFVPKGTPVVVNTYDLHHNPHVWDRPEVFDPARFAPGGEADQKAKTGMAWAPFYNGERMCIGMKFSMAEQRIMLSGLCKCMDSFSDYQELTFSHFALYSTQV
jgi:cytochrome P450